ncbi:hypothetical protein OJ998_10535 [Solirubrobacter taibaiensis]|nr:hypothetical protein [Solirubrobacter taibaiensis]
MSSHDSNRALSGEALLDAVTDAVVGLHRRHYGRFPATAETVMLAEDLLACTLGGVHVGPEEPERRLRRAGPVHDTGETAQSPHHTYIDVVQRVSGRTVLAFISDYDAGPNLAVELFWLAPLPARSPSPPLSGSRNGHRA